MQMWERSGGNKGMVDILVCAWNAANADQADQPELHRPHGDGGEDRPGRRLGRRTRPDGHGPDLRPAVRERRPAGRHHRPDEGLAGAGRCQPGPQDRRHVQRPPVRRPAVRRRVGAVLQQGPVHPGGARPQQAADQPGRAAHLRRRHHQARRRHQGLLPAGQLRRLQHLHRRSADVGVRRDDRGREVRQRAARRRRRQAGGPVGARHGRGRERPRRRAGRDRRHVRRAVRVGQARHDGDRELQHRARARPDEGPPVRVRHQPSAGRGSRASTPRSSAATWSSSRRAASASTTRSRSCTTC